MSERCWNFWLPSVDWDKSKNFHPGPVSLDLFPISMYLNYGTAPQHQGAAEVGSSTRKGDLGAEDGIKTLGEGCSPTVCKQEEANRSSVVHSPLFTRQPVVMSQVWDQARKSSQQDKVRTGMVQDQAQLNYSITQTWTKGKGLGLNAAPKPVGEVCVHASHFFFSNRQIKSYTVLADQKWPWTHVAKPLGRGRKRGCRGGLWRKLVIGLSGWSELVGKTRTLTLDKKAQLS